MAKVYTQIPGLGSGRGKLQVAMRSRLFRGPDHLLVVQSTGYTEEYRRIFYRDIRSVEVRRTQGQMWQAVIAIVFLAFFGLLALIPDFPKVFDIFFCAPFLVWLLINLFRGPTCDCYVVTSVQTLVVPTPGRVKKVPIFVAFLRAQVEALGQNPAAPQQQPA